MSVRSSLNKMKILLLVKLFILIEYSNGIKIYPDKIQINLKEFLRLRCSLDEKDEIITTWKGNVYLHVYQNEPKSLFKIVGMNIARCLNDSMNNEIILTSREVQLYVDLISEKKLNEWFNPFVGKNVSVIHVANDPVQSSFSAKDFSLDAYLTNNNQIVIPSDVNLFYPNPLYENETLRFYSKEKYYEAGEFFKFYTSLEQITNERLTQVNSTDISWTRISPVLPWMNMSSLDAKLIFSAEGTKINSLNELDPVLFNEIENRISIYKNAPSCQLNTTSETSWTYFKKYFQEYLSNEIEFPIPKSQEDIPCL